MLNRTIIYSIALLVGMPLMAMRAENRPTYKQRSRLPSVKEPSFYERFNCCNSEGQLWALKEILPNNRVRFTSGLLEGQHLRLPFEVHPSMPLPVILLQLEFISAATFSALKQNHEKWTRPHEPKAQAKAILSYLTNQGLYPEQQIYQHKDLSTEMYVTTDYKLVVQKLQGDKKVYDGVELDQKTYKITKICEIFTNMPLHDAALFEEVRQDFLRHQFFRLAEEYKKRRTLLSEIAH